MAQITTGIRAILSHPFIYDVVQNLLGARRARNILIKEHLKPQSGQSLLDIGCGTAQIFPYLPDGIKYVGIDLSEPYIKAAQKVYGNKGEFYCTDIAETSSQATRKYDLVHADGLLHHLDDEDAQKMLKIAYDSLAEGGYLITKDPCFDIKQSAIAHFIIKRDRGRNVRTPEQYGNLAKSIFNHVDVTVRHDMLYVPYTHAIIKSQK